MEKVNQVEVSVEKRVSVRNTEEEYFFCEDCTIAEVNGDFSGMSDETEEKVKKGMESLPEGIVPAFDVESGEGYFEFSRMRCDCCNTYLAGSRHKFTRLEVVK